MPGFAAPVTIPRSAPDVFEVVSDLATHPQWAADDLRLQRTGERTWRSIARAKGRTFHADIVVTVIDPDLVFEFVSADETGTYVHRFTVRHLTDGCELTGSVTTRRLGIGQQALFWLTLLPVRRPALRSSLARLATLLE